MIYCLQLRNTEKETEMYDTLEQRMFQLEVEITAATAIFRRDYFRMINNPGDKAYAALYLQSKANVLNLCVLMDNTLLRMQG